MTDYRIHTKDCPHEQFERVEKPALYLPPMYRCLACGLQWANSTAPVRAWAKREGIMLAGERPASSDDEAEPF